jgi:hypothetical protein
MYNTDAMSLGDRLGSAGLIVALFGIAAMYLWPDKKWIGWLCLVVAALLCVYWLRIELNSTRVFFTATRTWLRAYKLIVIIACGTLGGAIGLAFGVAAGRGRWLVQPALPISAPKVGASIPQNDIRFFGGYNVRPPSLGSSKLPDAVTLHWLFTEDFPQYWIPRIDTRIVKAAKRAKLNPQSFWIFRDALALSASFFQMALTRTRFVRLSQMQLSCLSQTTAQATSFERTG